MDSFPLSSVIAVISVLQREVEVRLQKLSWLGANINALRLKKQNSSSSNDSKVQGGEDSLSDKSHITFATRLKHKTKQTKQHNCIPSAQSPTR